MNKHLITGKRITGANVWEKIKVFNIECIIDFHLTLFPMFLFAGRGPVRPAVTKNKPCSIQLKILMWLPCCLLKPLKITKNYSKKRMNLNLDEEKICFLCKKSKKQVIKSDKRKKHNYNHKNSNKVRWAWCETRKKDAKDRIFLLVPFGSNPETLYIPLNPLATSIEIHWALTEEEIIFDIQFSFTCRARAITKVSERKTSVDVK